jgi:hypothetical protein
MFVSVIVLTDNIETTMGHASVISERRDAVGGSVETDPGGWVTLFGLGPMRD